MMNGIDISAHQRGIDVASVPSDFVIIKATEGLDYVNDDCDRAYQQAKAAGKCVGTYHFATGEASNGAQEAAYYLENIQGYIGESIMVLDWEMDALSRGVGYAKEFLDYVYQQTGIKPLIYMSGSVENEYNWTDVVNGDYGLWVAYYYNAYNPMGYNQDAPMYPLNYWNNVAILQYTSSGDLPNYGGYLDLNVFYGDASAWNAYAGAGDNPTPNPQPPAPQPVPDQPDPWPLLNIQYWMVTCNYNPAAPIDELEGPETTKGVRNGQRAYNVPEDGLFGYITQIPASAQVLAYETRLKELGFYMGELDGIPGPQFFNAIKAFQTSKGLEADGVIGELTSNAMFN